MNSEDVTTIVMVERQPRHRHSAWWLWFAFAIGFALGWAARGQIKFRPSAEPDNFCHLEKTSSKTAGHGTDGKCQSHQEKCSSYLRPRQFLLRTQSLNSTAIPSAAIWVTGISNTQTGVTFLPQ